MYSFADFEVDLLRGEVRKYGRKLPLQEKPYQILCLLLARRGEVVTREELRQRLWPSDTYVDFDANLNTSLNRLRNALGDKAREQNLIKTIPRHGYRFVSPVTIVDPAHQETPEAPHAPEAASVVESVPAGTPAAHQCSGQRRAIMTYAIGLLVAVLLIGIVWWRHRLAEAARSPHRFTILVTPFADLDASQPQDFLGDSLTDETITRLGKISPDRLGAIARSTAMQYKDAHKTAAQMAREQGADYVLEGGYRRQSNQLRITAQLFDARSQASIWSEIYERDATDLFTVERDVTEQIANSVSERLLGSSNPPPPATSR